MVDDSSRDTNEVGRISKAHFGDSIETTICSTHELHIKSNGHKVIYLIGRNRGPSYSRNIGINLTLDETDVYAILDADDAMSLTKVADLIRYFDDPKIGVVYADYWCKTLNTSNYKREFKHSYDFFHLQQDCIVHSGSLVRAQALKDVKEATGYYDETLRTCEDYDLWLRIAEKYMIVHHPEPLTTVTVHNDNATFSVPKEIWEANYRRVKQKVLERNAKKQ